MGNPADRPATEPRRIFADHRKCGSPNGYDGCYSHPVSGDDHCRQDGNEWPCDVELLREAAQGAAPRAEGLDVEKIVRATLLFIDQTTPLSVGEPLIQKAIRYATNLSRLTSKEERP